MTHPLEQWARNETVSQEAISGEQPLNSTQRALSFTAGPVDPVHNSASKYVIEGFDAATNPQWVEGEGQTELVVLFQNGVVPEVGVNGVTPEILLDIMIHKYEGYQAGKFACEENAQALRGFHQARDAIRSRTANRIERKVEGSHEV